MKRFVELFDALDTTASTNEKVEAMCRYFTDAPHADAAWALFVLTGERLRGVTSSALLREEAARATDMPAWMLEECHAAVGDWSETIALLLPTATKADAELSLAEVMTTRVRPLATADDTTRRAILREAWSSLDERARLVYHKLIRGGLRLGVQRKLVIRALAAASGVDESLLERRLIGGVRPDAAWFAALIDPTLTPADHGRPAPFMLASQLPTGAAADPGSFLGDAASWRAEWKYDGIRAQLVRSQPVSGAAPAAHLWSRGEERIDTQFPEIIALARHLPPGTILDGEVLVWRGADRPAPFSVLQTYLNRVGARGTQPGLFDADRVVFMAFDVLEHDGRDLRESTFDERRAVLESIVRSCPDDTLRLSPLVPTANWPAWIELRLGARTRGVEGLMLKHSASPYVSGRQRIDTRDAGVGGWWKWKLDPYCVDAVLVHAQPGSGKRAGLYTDYTFALWRVNADATRELVAFAKAYSGLEKSEIEEVDAFIRRHTLTRNGPFRTVEPLLVFELGFEGVQESTRHKSGLAVRFPRILRWRRDKTAADADTLETLRAMLPA
ncbi:MAG: ATP-dependent DNA ligase [Planctomycetota bacterium]|nr:ATP-dependent DNA ligase [Planctomycetota bacterium]